MLLDKDLLLPQNPMYLIAGVIVLLDAIVSTYFGKTCGRGGWTYRSTNPVDFWGTMAVLYIGSIFFIGKYLGPIYLESIFHPKQWLR